MLNSLSLKYFKCFELLHLPLEPLTLLSGTNASGKSSVLQALVLLHQTMREHEWSTRLMLNGEAIRLGTVTDVVDEINGLKSVDIGIVDEEQSYLWTFTGERKALSMAVDCVVVNKETYQHPTQLQHLLPPNLSISTPSRIKNLTYITAERIGPREVYALEDEQSTSVVGPKGEHAISVFYSKSENSVLNELLIANESRNTLYHQVTARMRQFFPECGLLVEQVPNVNAVTLRLRTSDSGEFHRPINVGFGLTQVLPIVIAALSAQKEDILLIENPEVHLHPSGQALMGQFLAEVANAGVQVILETHSDHVLNGIRRFVKAGKISPNKVALHFFRARSADTVQAQVVSPQINANGDLDCSPDGFFDQFDKDMNHFAGWD
jgi:predicted ATPase